MLYTEQDYAGLVAKGRTGSNNAKEPDRAMRTPENSPKLIKPRSRHEEGLFLQIRAAGLPMPVSTPIRLSKRNRDCIICGKDFYASPGHLAQGWGIYCSMTCRNSAWIGSGNPRWMGKLGDCVCKNCGKSFRCKPSHISKGEGLYCSRACFLSFAGPRERTCEQCGRKFSAHQAQIRKKEGAKYCSRTCRDDKRRTAQIRNCIVCNKGFLMKPCDLSRKDKKSVGSFCSTKCKGKAMSRSQLTVAGVNRNQGNGGGKREDLEGRYFRSTWEANYARYLNWLISLREIGGWEFEVDTFEFPVKRGTRFYTPDFKVRECSGAIRYHEVKGWMTPKSKTQIARMARYYPKILLILIDSPAYYAIAKKVKRIIPNWE